jgi:hypothetical protein
MHDLLNVELRVLLLRHGRRRVVETLALLGEQTIEEIEAELAAASDKKKPGRNRRQPRSATEIAAELLRDKPENREAVQRLATRYDNKAFLPQLRDVQRFLDRAGASRKRLRDRRTAAAQVMAALSRLGADELKQMAASAEVNLDSDYALLAREIIGNKARSSSD